MGGQDAAVGRQSRLLLGLEHDGTGAIAEQYTGAAIVPIEDPRKRLGANHQRALEGAGSQEIVGGGKRKYKSRTDGLQVEGGAVVDSEPVLYGNGRGGKRIVGCRGRKNDKINGLGVDAGIGQGGLRGPNCQMRGEFALGGDMALVNSGSLNDPFVGRVDPRRQFSVGQYLLRQVGTAAEHDRTGYSHETASCGAGAKANPPPSRWSILLILLRRSYRTIS